MSYGPELVVGTSPQAFVAKPTEIVGCISNAVIDSKALSEPAMTMLLAVVLAIQGMCLDTCFQILLLSRRSCGHHAQHKRCCVRAVVLCENLETGIEAICEFPSTIWKHQ